MDKLRAWLMANRSSVRMAFTLRLFAMAASAGMSLVWTRLLLDAMGPSIYGLFIAFTAVTSLGGLGDLGMGGAVAIKAGQLLGQKRENELVRFLASARTLFLGLALVLFAMTLALSPWLPQWLHFQPVEEAGSLPVLFAVGSVSIGLVLTGSYVHAVNYATGTVTWPIITTLVLSQLGMFAQWCLAHAGAPLWLQWIPLVIQTLTMQGAIWWMVRVVHPRLADIRPLERDSAIWRSLGTASFWNYFWVVGTTIYLVSDRLLINAAFGAAWVPPYVLNNKLCELAISIISSACFAGLPKLTHWLVSPDPAEMTRAREGIHMLQIFEVLAACFAALGYLSINEWFIRFWLGTGYQVSLPLQLAFAANMAVTLSGNLGIQLAGRLGANGLRNSAVAVGLGAAVNITLSVIAMNNRFLEGIALATVLAQSLVSLSLGWRTCRHLALPWPRWLLRTWVLPLILVIVAGWLRWQFPPISAVNTGLLVAAYLAMLAGMAAAVGLRPQVIAREWAVFRAMFKTG